MALPTHALKMQRIEVTESEDFTRTDLGFWGKWYVFTPLIQTLHAENLN